MKRTMALKSAAVLGVASLALAACGGSSTSSESSAAPAASEAAPAASEAAPASEAPASEAAAASGPCKIGTMLPQTGNLAFLGPPEFAGVDLAVKEINEAGGVNGAPLEVLNGDSGDTTTDIASQTADSHIGAGVSAIIGAASSGVSLTVIDKITGAGVIQFSPANTSPTARFSAATSAVLKPGAARKFVTVAPNASAIAPVTAGSVKIAARKPVNGSPTVSTM